MLAGIDLPTSGNILFDDINLSTLPIQQKVSFLQDCIGIVFQQSLLINELSVLENIMLKQIIKGNLKDKHEQHAKQLLQSINMLDKANCAPNTLSGGQQQRIALLRAIFHTPKFLLADELTGNLDKESGQKIMELLFNYQKKYGIGLIISTHDMTIAKKCDYIITIENKNLSQQNN